MISDPEFDSTGPDLEWDPMVQDLEHCFLHWYLSSRSKVQGPFAFYFGNLRAFELLSLCYEHSGFLSMLLR
jgi:hypothetical protein